MMIKYRVHEVAKDLNVPNKDVIDLLQKHFGEVKKHMTALTEAELDVVFDYFTQKNQVENFDSFFAQNEQEQAAQEPPKEEDQTPVQEKQEPKAQQEAKGQQPAQQKRPAGQQP